MLRTAAAHVVSPIDAIPDVLPVVDAVVLTAAVAMAAGELHNCRRWRKMPAWRRIVGPGAAGW